MARAKKAVEPVVEPVVEEVKVSAPKTYFIVLEGAKGQNLEGAINGAHFSMPKGIEIEVNGQIYNAVKAYIISERN